MIETKASRVNSLLRALALYVEARGRLLQIEAREAGSRFSIILVLAVLLSGSFLVAWMLTMPALIWLIADKQGWPWWYVALGAAALHLLFALVLSFALLVRLKKMRIFEETFHQFQRDRESLGDLTRDEA